jgi:hypothetical protein
VNTGENQWEVNYEHGQCLNSVYTHVLFWTRSATRSTWHECSDRRSCDWSRLVSSKKNPNELSQFKTFDRVSYIYMCCFQVSGQQGDAGEMSEIGGGYRAFDETVACAQGWCLNQKIS